MNDPFERMQQSISHGGMAHMHIPAMIHDHGPRLSNVHERIVNYTKLAARGIKPECKFMYFDEGLKFIVDGNMLKLLPLKYHHLYSKQEFFVHINPVDKRVMYYAYDLSKPHMPLSSHINKEEGYMLWDEVEDCLYNFFVLNIRDIASSAELGVGHGYAVAKALTEVKVANPKQSTTLTSRVAINSPHTTAVAIVSAPCSKAYYGVGDCTCGKCKNKTQKYNRNPFGY